MRTLHSRRAWFKAVLALSILYAGTPTDADYLRESGPAPMRWADSLPPNYAVLAVMPSLKLGTEEIANQNAAKPLIGSETASQASSVTQSNSVPIGPQTTENSTPLGPMQPVPFDVMTNLFYNPGGGNRLGPVDFRPPLQPAPLSSSAHYSTDKP